MTPKHEARYEGWTLRWTRGFRRKDPEVSNAWIGDFAYATSPDGSCKVELFSSHGGDDEAATDDPKFPAQAQDAARLLTVVGPYVSYLVDTWWTGGAHGGTIYGFRTADMRTGAPLTLDELFGHDAIEEALQAPPPMPLVLDGQPVRSAAWVLENSVSREHDPDGVHCGPSVSTFHRATEFAISDYTEGKAFVRVWAHDDDFFCLERPLKIDLWVAVPEALRPAFEAALRAGRLPVEHITSYDPCDPWDHCTHPPGEKPGPPSGKRWSTR